MRDSHGNYVQLADAGRPLNNRTEWWGMCNDATTYRGWLMNMAYRMTEEEAKRACEHIAAGEAKMMRVIEGD